MPSTSHLTPLCAALQKREEIIADRAWYARDPSAHLAALQEISATLFQLEEELRPVMPPRLRHFMESRSYQKALHFLTSNS